MARFKNKDLHILQNEEILFGDSQEASIKYDGSNLLTNKLLEHTVDGPYATREWVEQTVAGLEWQDSVLSRTTYTAFSIPSAGDGSSEGDRYILGSASGSVVDDDFNDGSISGIWTQDTGVDGSFTEADGVLKITAGSGYFNNNTNTPTYIYQTLPEGAFDVRAEVTNYSDIGASWEGSYILCRLSVSPNFGVKVGVAAQTGTRRIAYWHNVGGDQDYLSEVDFAASTVWLRLARDNSGNFSAYYSTTSISGPWTQISQPATVNVDTQAGEMGFEATYVGGVQYTVHWDNFTSVQTGESIGSADDIVEWDSSTWDITTPSAGFASYVEDEGIYYVYNGSSWIKLGGVVSHSALLDLDVDDHTQYLLADGSRAAAVLTVTAALTAAEIQVSQGAEDDEAILFRSTDVAHGITDYAETDIYGHLAKADADAGGAGLWGFSESTIGSSIYSYYGDAQGDTDKDTTALGAITLYTLQASGTGVQDVGATDNLLVLRPRRSGALSSSLIADGSGNLYVDGDYRSIGTTLDVLTSNNYGMSIAADGTITFTGSVSGTDHGLLAGLADDDHTQYYHTDGRRSWSGALTVESAESKIEFLEDLATIGVTSKTDLMTLAPTAVTFDGDVYCNTLHSASASVIIGSVTMSDVDGVLTVDSVISSPSGSGGSDYATLGYVDAELVAKSAIGHDHDTEYYTQAISDLTFSPITSGVTGGDSHDHTAGAGAQIDHTGLANKGTNTHATIDTHISNLNSHNNTYHSDTYITTSSVTYETLDGNSDVGTSAGQLAIGNHSHGSALWTYGSQVATTSGTTVVLTTSIPSDAVEIEIIFVGVSTNTSSQPPIVELGDSGGYETTGYVSRLSYMTGAERDTDGLYTHDTGAWSLNDVMSGVMRLTRWDSSEHLWLSYSLTYVDAATPETQPRLHVGWKTTSAALTSIRLTTPGGSATFDAGEARVRYR